MLFAMKFFLGIMGFKPSFLLLHSSLFEIEPQRQKQQLYPRIPFPGCQVLKSFFISPKAPSRFHYVSQLYDTTKRLQPFLMLFCSQ